jgi:ElaB/YqjD/DUF883 family membrane-anchored ribosome-binding protein
MSTSSSSTGNNGRKESSETSSNLEADLQTLREEFRRLAEQVAAAIASTGNAAWQRAKPGIDRVVADAEGKGREAADAMREVSGHFVGALDESIKTRPYTTLAFAAGLGFLLGALWRR